MCVGKNFKFRNANSSIFSEFGGEISENLKEMCQNHSYSFRTAHNSAEHAVSVRKNKKSAKKQKEEFVVSVIGHFNYGNT